MTDYPKKVVVTGMGLVSPIGLNLEDYWKNLLNGKSGVAPITKFDTTDFKTKFAAELKEFDPEDYMDRREARYMDPFCHYAVAAADMAIKDAGLEEEKLDLNRIGVIVGSGIGGMCIFENQVEVMLKHGPRRITPFFVPIMIIDIASGHISMRHNFKGPNFATVSACATASHAIGTAVDNIRLGRADVMVCGGSEAPITKMGIGGFNAMRAISTRNDEPEKASRPFDKDRDGFIVGEGSGILILEAEEHAKTRGARIYAEITGVGFTADAYHITAPAPGGEGAVRAMKMALDETGISPEEVDYINAHGTSTLLNDKNETEAIKTLFGEHAYKLKVSSTKSMIGHLLGAAGGVESIATIMSVVENKIHPTINYDTPDPDCDLDYVPNKAIKHTTNHALCNTFGFGGHNASLLFSKYQ
ncbi:MAG: beta-ketoacyl-ACP synthase II [candidate division Zixibacteria bacterium]|nr:beta-ketoacyl-ACP synthase II [Candidatus Tariuqbacter arcticus]